MLRAARTLGTRPRIRPRIRTVSLLSCGLLAAGLLGGCTEDESTGRPSASSASATVSAATVADLAALYAGDGADGADPATATCFAEALAGRTTLEELEDAGLVGTEAGTGSVAALPDALAEKWVSAQAECVDAYAELARAQTAFAKGDLRAGEYAACLRAAVPETQLRAALVDGLTGAWDSVAVTALAGAQARCADQRD